MIEKPQDILPIKPKGIKLLPTSFDNDKILEIKNQEILNYNIKLKNETLELKNEINIDNELKTEMGIKNKWEFEKIISFIEKNGVSRSAIFDNMNLITSIKAIAPEMFSIYNTSNSSKETLGYFYRDIAKLLKQPKESINKLSKFIKSKDNIYLKTSNIYTIGLLDLSNIINHKGFDAILNYIRDNNIELKIGKQSINTGSFGINFIKIIEDIGDVKGGIEYNNNTIRNLITDLGIFFDEKLKIDYDEIYLYSAYDSIGMNKDKILEKDKGLFDLIKKNNIKSKVICYYDRNFVFLKKDIEKLKNTDKKILIYIGSHGFDNGSGGNADDTYYTKKDVERINSIKNTNIQIHYEKCFANLNGNKNSNINYGSINAQLNFLSTERLINTYINSDQDFYDYDGSKNHKYRESIIDRVLYDNYSILQIGINHNEKTITIK